MSVQVEKLENSSVKLTIEVPAEDFVKACEQAYNRQKKKISIPGFRRGKAPMFMVEKMYGPEVFYEEAANSLIPKAYEDAAKESGEDIVSRPEVDVVQIEKGQPFIFTAEVAVRPEIELDSDSYKGVEVTKIDTSVADEDVEKELERRREQNARSITVEDRAIEKGDTAVIDFDGSIDGKQFEGGKGENYSLKIGSGEFIEGFEDQLIGKNTGDELDVNVTFPEDYQVNDLKGKDAVFKVKIHEIKTDELPDLNDEFAQDVSEFDTLDELREDIRKEMEASKENQAKEVQKQEAVSKIVDTVSVELPKAMVLTRCNEIVNEFAQQLAQQGMNISDYMKYADTDIDKLSESVRPEAERRIMRELVIDKIAELENVEITDEEVDNQIHEMADQYHMPFEELNGYMNDQDRENIRLDMAGKKALEVVYDNAVFVDPPAEEEKDDADAEKAETGDDASDNSEASKKDAE